MNSQMTMPHSPSSSGCQNALRREEFFPPLESSAITAVIGKFNSWLICGQGYVLVWDEKCCDKSGNWTNGC